MNEDELADVEGLVNRVVSQLKSGKLVVDFDAFSFDANDEKDVWTWSGDAGSDRYELSLELERRFGVPPLVCVNGKAALHKPGSTDEDGVW